VPDITSKLAACLQDGDTLERCGFITARGRVVEVKNVAEDPTVGFRVAAADTLKWAEKARGTWHTHPDSDANLSEEDYAGFSQWPSLRHYIVGRRDGAVEVRCYVVRDGLVVNE